jgi:hypothetical protein
MLNLIVLRCGKLAKTVGLTRMQVFRLARAGLIPGVRRSGGGHFYFAQCPALEEWIKRRVIRKGWREAAKRLPDSRWVKSRPALKERRALKNLVFLVSALAKHPADYWTPSARELWREALGLLVGSIKSIPATSGKNS